MQIRISISWRIIVYDDIDTFDINSTSEDVSGDQYPLLKVLEFLVAGDTIRTGSAYDRR